MFEFFTLWVIERPSSPSRLACCEGAGRSKRGGRDRCDFKLEQNLTDRCWREAAVTVEQKRTNRIPTWAIANRLPLIYAQKLRPRVQIATSEALYESWSSKHGDGGGGGLDDEAV